MQDQTSIYFLEHLKHQEYLGVKRISHSMLKQIEPTPNHFLAYQLANDREVTSAMIMGTLVHAYVLDQPHDSVLAIQPETYGPDCKKWNNNATECREWHSLMARKNIVVLTAKEFDTVLGCVKAIKDHPLASELAAKGNPEVSIFGVDEETGLPVKIRPDLIATLPGQNCRVLADIKTVPPGGASPDAFANHAWDMGYFTQAAFYLNQYHQAVSRLRYQADLPAWMDTAWRFISIVVEKGDPSKGHPFEVALYEYDAESLSKAHEINRSRLSRLKRCVDTGFHGYPTSIQTISAPRWALKQ